MALGALVLLVSLAGCASQQAVPRDPADVPGYLNAPPDLADVDPAPLLGRRILLDPGHGGFFRGAVGDDGLSEAEVNLGVALYLQGLLQWAGAEVFMTRTADVDFLSPADSTLSSDLSHRVAMADSLLPDVFLSIHHNSTAQRDPDINETQTYYPLGRDGADLDLARAVHRQLVRALEIEPAKILPGGFHVLRNAPVPAVLGEPAMISNPVIEGRLSLARSLELEASAYFLGLRDYFATGMPHWVTDLPDTLTPLNMDARWTFDPGAPQAPTLDPASLQVTVDGRPIPYVLLPDGQGFSIENPAQHRGSRLVIRGRNLAGRTAPDRVHGFDQLGLGTWSTAFFAESGPPPRRGVLTYAHSTTSLATFGPVLFSHRDRAAAGQPLPTFPGRRGWLLIEAAPADLTEHVIARRLEQGETFAVSDSRPEIYGLPPGVEWIWLDAPADIWPDSAIPGGAWRSRMVRDSGLAGFGRTDWPVATRTLDDVFWLEAAGASPLVLEPGVAAAAPESLTWIPLLPDLIGKRVALDPRGGGTDDQGLGPLGARGSELNLQVAERLAALLRGAGCEVAMLREAEIFVPDPERVRRADAHGADLYLAIGRGEPGVRHHHGSTVGTPWAASCAASLAPLVPDTVAVAAAYDYVLRHTACPAIVVDLESPANTAVESRLTDPAWQDAVARALFRGTVAMLQPDAPFLAVTDLLDILGDRAIPRDRLDLVRLDGNLSWLPPSGQVTGAPLPSWSADDPGLPVRGDHHVIELRAGPHWQLWTLDRVPGGQWHGRVLLENR